MKNLLFEGTMKYSKMFEDGIAKTVSEKVIVEAISITEAESRIIDEMTPFIEGEFGVQSVRRANIVEVFYSTDENADKFYKCKLFFITLDEKSGAEKKTQVFMLVQAADLRDAVKKLDEGMKGTMADYVIASVADANIVDVYPYPEGEAKDKDSEDETEEEEE